MNEWKDVRSQEPEKNQQLREKWQVNLARETLLLSYLEALDTGDLETIGQILEIVHEDPTLEQAIWQTHLARGEEIDTQLAEEKGRLFEQDADIVRDLTASHFSTSIDRKPKSVSSITEDINPATPLTVADIVADIRKRMGNDPVLQTQLLQIENDSTPLGDDVSLRGIRTLLTRFGLQNVGRQFIDMFHDAAMSLAFQRKDDAFRLAATRRQREQHAGKSDSTKSKEAGEASEEEGMS